MQLRLPTTYLTESERASKTIHEPHGGNAWTAPEQGCNRVGFQNANGIERGRHPADDVISTAKEFHLDIFGIAEPNVAFDDEITSRINAAIKQSFGSGLISPASISSSKTGYLPGGTLQVTRGTMVGRQEISGGSKLGSFSWTKFQGKKEKLVVITAYRVTQKKGAKATSGNCNTAYWQQVKAMVKDGKEKPDPRNQVLSDLTHFIDKAKLEGYEILLMLDANESIEERGSKFTKFVERNSLHDIHETIMSDLPSTTRLGSRHRIDFMLASERILEYVTNGGYAAVHEGIHSDHILLWADINMKEFFRGDAPRHVPPQAREFNCDNTKMRDKFLEELAEIHEHQRLSERIHKLETEFRVLGPTPQLVRRYNALDRELVESIKAAARRTVTRKQHGYARSPALVEAGGTVLFWRSVLSSKRHMMPITGKATRLGERNDIPLDKANDMTLGQTHKAVQAAWSSLRECQQQAGELRAKWLENSAKYKADVEGDLDAGKVLQTMVRNLRERSMHKKLTRIAKGARSGLDFIEVPTGEWYYSPSNDELYHYDKGVFEAHAADPSTQSHFLLHHSLKVIPDDAWEANVVEEVEGYRVEGVLIRRIEWQRVSDKEEIETLLMQRNKRHLQQMAKEESPPSQQYFDDLLDNFGASPLADKVLEGEVTNDLDQFPHVIREWLKQFTRTEEERRCIPIDGMIYPHEFQQAFRAVNEKTSSSPSGIHYTFWKAMASDPTMAAYLVVMMRLPFMYGFKNDRWAKCIDVMLEKKKGIRRIHQLRIIGLVEADFNTALKLFFAKQMVANSENTTLSEEQWGGRPGRTATDPALRKMLAFEYGRAMFVTIALFANDATACFNRMVPNISTLVAMKYGVQPSVMKSRNIVMATMEHSIRTKHGDSSGSYRQLPGDVQLAGETQGKGDVASLWSVESQTILRAHQALHEGIYLPHVQPQRKAISKNNDSFVDDTDAMASVLGDTYYSSEKRTAQRIERGSQIWADLINATGGAIAHHKCACQMLAFQDHTFPPKLKERSTQKVVLDDGRGAKTEIKQKRVDEPNKGLGCLMAPSGQQESEFEFRLKQCRDAASRTSGAILSRREAHFMLSGRIVPQVTYSMPVTSLSSIQCRKMNTAIDRVMLPKLGVNQHMPKGSGVQPTAHGRPQLP